MRTMVLITQIWSTELGRYVEDELSLCECLPAAVREGLAQRPQIACEALDELWAAEMAESA